MKELTHQQRCDILRASNNRLVVFGLFNPKLQDRKSEPRVLKRNPDPENQYEYPLSAAAFFEAIKPSYALAASGKERQVGASTFLGTKIMAPLAFMDNGLKGDLLAIVPKRREPGPVPEKDATELTQYQAMGGYLFSQLLKNLSQLALFDGGDFSSRLLDVAHEYMRRFQVDQPGPDIAIADWSPLRYDYRVASGITGYMTAPESDLSHALEGLQAALERGFPKATGEQIGQLKRGIQECRQVLESDSSDDPLLADLMKGSCRYLKDYKSEPGASRIPEVGAASFGAHYQYFLRVFTDISLFLRNAPLHSHVVLWMSAKLGAVDDGRYSRGDWVEGAFARTVRDQQHRVKPATEEELKRNKGIVASAKEGVGGFADELGEVVLTKLRPQFVFTRKRLASENESRFVDLSAMVEGVEGQLLSEASLIAEHLGEVYHSVRGLDSSTATVEKLCGAIQRYRGKADARFDDVLDRVVADIEGCGLAGEALHERANSALAEATAQESLGFYDRERQQHRGQIESESMKARRAYGVHGQLSCSKGSPLVFAPVVHTVDLSASNEKVNQSIKQALLEQARESAPQVKVQVTVPSAVLDQLPSAKESSLLDDAGREIAKIRPAETGQAVEVTPSQATEGRQFRSGSTDEPPNRVRVPGEKEPLVLEGLNLSPVAEGLDEQEVALTPEDTEVGRLVAARKKIQERCVKDVAETGTSPFVQRYMALLLGEVMMAAPPGAIDLNKMDLSSPLSLLLDAVESWGDLANLERLEDPTRELEPDVQERLNLSRHFAIEHARDLGDLVEHHQSECRSYATEVDAYFKEVDGIAALLNTLQEGGGDPEVVVYDCTLGEHLAYMMGTSTEGEEPADDATEGNLFLCKASAQAATAYLTGQAKAEQGLSDLAAALHQPFGLMASRATDESVARMQLPAFVSQSPIRARVGFSVVSPAELKVPNLGTAVAGGAPDVPFFLALALSALGSGSVPELGVLKAPRMRERKALAEAFNLSPRAGQLWSEYLAQIWSSKDGTLLPQFCCTRYLNLSMLLRSDSKELLASLVGAGSSALTSSLEEPETNALWIAAFGPFLHGGALKDRFIPRIGGDPIPGHSSSPPLVEWLFAESRPPLCVGPRDAQRVFKREELGFLKTFVQSLGGAAGGQGQAAPKVGADA